MTLSGTLLYETHIDLADPIAVGPTPEGYRAIYCVTGGTFKGERLSGTFLSQGGADWVKIRADGSIAVDVRACMQTDDGALIYITYQGRIVIPPEIQEQVLDMSAADRPDPSQYYFRVAPLFESSSEKYAWLNHICAVGVGRIVQGGVEYQVYAID